MSGIIYKICDRQTWEVALGLGRYEGSADDIRDGFIHFSTPAQVQRSAAKHFAGKKNLILAAVDVSALGDVLKWEPSRAGALFPHLYGPLDMRAVIWTQPLPLDDASMAGEHIFPEGVIT